LLLPIDIFVPICYNINKIREAENPKPQKGKVNMVTFKIVIHKNKERCKVIEKRLKENARLINETIYSVLTFYGIDEITAIDCACWAEYAVVDETYNTEELDVYVE
jgi:hypothetical protein